MCSPSPAHLARLVPLQVFLCEQVISYLKQFVAADGGSKAAAKEVVEAPEPGMKLLKKKEEEEFMVTSVKKGKGARKAAEKDKAVDSKAKVGGTWGIRVCTGWERAVHWQGPGGSNHGAAV